MEFGQKKNQLGKKKHFGNFLMNGKKEIKRKEGEINLNNC